MRSYIVFTTLILLAVVVPRSDAVTASADKTVVRHGTITEDTYLAGSRINVDAEVDGDLVVAGGVISVDGTVSGDVIAAGGEITIAGSVADDVRAAGAQVSLCSAVSGHAVVAGGDINFCPETAITDSTWIVGGDVTFDGQVGRDLNIRAGHITFAGRALQNVNLEANSIEFLPGAEIVGNLDYKSHEPAKIHDGAEVLGKITHTASEGWWGHSSDEGGNMLATGIVFFIGLIICITLTAVVLSWLLPQTFAASAELISGQFLRSIGIGLLVSLLTPLIILLLAITIVGIPLALILLLLYILLLVGGLYATLLYVAQVINDWLVKDRTQSMRWQLLSVALAVLLLVFLCVIPIIGGIVITIVYLVGIGAICLHILERRRASQSPTPGL